MERLPLSAKWEVATLRLARFVARFVAPFSTPLAASFRTGRGLATLHRRGSNRAGDALSDRAAILREGAQSHRRLIRQLEAPLARGAAHGTRHAAHVRCQISQAASGLGH